MLKIDLITGFLGAGKTTFLKKYVTYLKEKGEKICILENDYGAINVDMMLISDLGVDSEMVAGGCDYDCHKRRFKTKLISMAMRGYTRIVVEPSGIYDTDEFFDTMYEEPIDSMYEIGNVISIVDTTMNELSNESKYFLASQIAVSGGIVFSKTDSNSSNIELTKYIIKQSLEENECSRDINSIIFDSKDLDKIFKCGYSSYSYKKRDIIENNKYESLYYMNNKYDESLIKELSLKLLDTNEYGNVIRIKGYYKDNNKWYNINVTKDSLKMNNIPNGQDVIIVIGESLNKEKIDNLMERK